MAKENPPTNEIQVAFDLGEEASDPPTAQADPGKKPAGKLVKKNESGGENAKVGARKAAKPPASETETAAQNAAAKADPAKSPPEKGAAIISIADDTGPPNAPPEKAATPRPERPMPASEPEPAAGNGAEQAGSPPVEISAGGETGGEEMAGEEMAGEESEPIIQLINNREGCWKVLSDGERVALSNEEWRSELARHFKRESPAGR